MSFVPAIQDMPPPGGFKAIDVSRIPLQPVKHPYRWLGLFIVHTMTSFLYIKHKEDMRRRLKVEQKSAELALTPLIAAEQQRLLLKQLILNRRAEEIVMKDVEGWEIGNFMSDPIFKTVQPNEWRYGPVVELYAFVSYKELKKGVSPELRKMGYGGKYGDTYLREPFFGEEGSYPTKLMNKFNKLCDYIKTYVLPVS